MRLVLNPLLILLVTCSLLSCGKENTLRIDELWSIRRQPSQSDHAEIEVSMIRSFPKEGPIQSELVITLDQGTSTLASKMFFTVGKSVYQAGLTSVDHSDVFGKQIRITSTATTIQSQSTIEIPQPLFSFNRVPSENHEICITSTTSASSLTWDYIGTGDVFIKIKDSTKIHETDLVDYGFWEPGYDFLQSFFPDILPESDTQLLKDIDTTASISRTNFGEMKIIGEDLKEKTLRIKSSTFEVFPLALKFNCPS